MQAYVARVVESLARLTRRMPVDATASRSWVRADDVRILWYIQTYRDLPRLRKALARVRALYPESQILVVSDGDPDPAIPAICGKHSASFSLRPRLYGVEHGGELVHRILEAFLATDADVLTKIDPDTSVRRRFTLMPPPTARSIYGTVQSAGSSRAPSIQGGCIIVPRQAAILLASSELLLSDRLKPPALEWAVDARTLARARFGLTSSDQTLGWACRELGLDCRHHPEVFSRYRPSLMDAVTQRGVAVFHPRFEIGHLANPEFYFSGLRAAVAEALTGRGDITLE
jgi:hypothetical protein